MTNFTLRNKLAKCNLGGQTKAPSNHCTFGGNENMGN
jgi:hypothetical protein